MMKTFRKLVAIWVILLSMAFLFSSCRKYDDGPTFSLISKKERVANDWKTVTVFRNDIDETKEYPTYSINFGKKDVTWKFQRSTDTNPTEITGTWELASVKEQIKISYVVGSETRLQYMDILRLTETELWVSYLRDGDYFDIRLKD